MNLQRIMAITRIDSPWKLTVSYVVFSLVWIVGSDALVAWRLEEGVQAWLVDSTKGLLFVAVTGGLLYLLVKRLVDRTRAVERALRESQLRWQYALEGAGDGLWDWNAETNQVYFSRQWKAMLGYAEDEIGEDLAEWETRVHPDDLARVKAVLKAYFKGESATYQSEHRLRMKDGSYKWILDRGQIISRLPDGRPLRVIGTHSDISLRKSSEMRINDDLVFIQAVIQSSPVGIIVYEPSGRTVIANQAAARIVGTEVRELLRQNFRSLESWRQYGLLADAEQAMTSGRAVRSNRSLVTSFGHALQAEMQFVPFEHQAGRHLLLLLADETEKRQVLDRLQVMHAALLAAPVGWVVTDPDGVIEWVNPGFTILTGYRPEDVIGRNPRILKSGRHPPEFYAEMWTTIKEGRVWSGEMFNQRKDGGLYHEYMTIAPVRDEAGKVAHYVAIKQDLTERKNLEQQLARAQRLESIGLLASGIAHDLNNIFAPIQLSLELLKLKYPTADGKKMLELIETSVHRGAGIVRQVLTFARGIDSERILLNPKYLMKELAQIMDETLPRQIKIETRLGPDLQSIEGDSTQLHQVLLNLAINARDAMPNGGRLSLGVENTIVDPFRAMLNPPLKPGPHVALIVEDTGTGVAPEVLEHMFEPFYSTKPRGKGTGLGLSTVYGIVRSHGGAVEVASKLGAGTKFTVLLPAMGAVASRPDSNPPLPSVLHGAGRRILVVDDEESIRLITLHALQRHGFVPEVAVDGREALEIFQVDPTRFAAIVTDLMMPHMNGRELVREIRRLAPALPIIASSGLSEEKGDESPETSLRALGVKTILRKPYTEAELLEALGRELVPGPS